MNDKLYDKAQKIREAIAKGRSTQDIVDLGIRNGALALKVLKAEICDKNYSADTALADYRCCRNTEELARLARTQRRVR